MAGIFLVGWLNRLQYFILISFYLVIYFHLKRSLFHYSCISFSALFLYLFIFPCIKVNYVTHSPYPDSLLLVHLKEGLSRFI